MDRLALLNQMVEQKPGDPFVRYGLAMELTKLGRHAEAWSAFEALIARSPEYVATYLMAGNLLVTMGESKKALGIYDKGIEVAKAAADDHTVSELEAARAGAL